jgi:hypothetical protein
MWYVLDENDEPVLADSLEASKWWDNKRRTVARDELPDDVCLSTVFLVLDHSMGRGDAPILYESMWFGGPFDGDQRRYKTKQEALEGHAEMLNSYNEYMTHREDKINELDKLLDDKINSI